MAEQTDIKSMLREAAFFQDFDDDLLSAVARTTTVEHHQAGSLILRDGDPAEKFYLIRHGTVSVELAAPPEGALVLQTLHEGEALGWSWLMPPYRWSFDGRAQTLVRTLTIDAKALRPMFEQNHELGYQVMKRVIRVIGGRLVAARLQMLDLYAPAAGRTR